MGVDTAQDDAFLFNLATLNLEDEANKVIEGINWFKQETLQMTSEPPNWNDPKISFTLCKCSRLGETSILYVYYYLKICVSTITGTHKRRFFKDVKTKEQGNELAKIILSKFPL